MVLNIFPALLGAALIAGGAVRAADYTPSEFLGLDLSKAVLSPKRLGPANEFAPVAVEAKGDTKGEPSGVIARNDAKKVAVERVKVAKAHRGGRVAEAQGEKPRGAARARLAHRHGNPLNAQAMDTRIQKWPCNPDEGGICAWRH
jgi:hypothetical protein